MVTGMGRILSLVLAGLLSALPMSVALAQEAPRAFAHVRPITPDLERLVDRGYALSTTFRNVVDGLQGTTVIVHLMPAEAPDRDLWGALNLVATASGYRYLRVFVRPDLDATVLISVLAHELQHASEIGHAPAVVDNETLRDHYRLAGVESCLHSERQCYDTRRARQTGTSVYAEMVRAAADR